MNRAIPSRQQYLVFREQHRKNQARDAASESAYSPASTHRSGRSSRRLQEYIHWLWPFAGALGLLLFLSLFGACLQMVQPLFSRYIIDKILVNADLSGPARIARLHLTGALFLLVVISNTLIYMLKQYWLHLLNARMVVKLSRSLYLRLLSLPLDELREMKTGGLLSRLSVDVEATTGLSHTVILSPAVSAVSLFIAIGALAALNWGVALMASVIVGSTIMCSLMSARRAHRIFRGLTSYQNAITGRLGEVFSGIRMVRAYRREKYELLDFVRGRNAASRMELLAQRLILAIGAPWHLFIGCIAVATVWYGAHLNLLGKISVGDIMAFQWYAVLLLTPASDIVNSFAELQRTLASTDRVFDVLAMNSDKPDVPDAREAPRVVHELHFENVDFAYREREPVVRDFSVTVQGGAMVALVGRSGSGKTTVLDLVARFQDPTKGRILLNGCDIRKMRLSSYRSLLAIVPQETFLFDGSIRDNIKYGRPEATDEQIRDAAMRANAHEFVARLPEQYETCIGERGAKLSGGEQQRIAIARAILASPQILIMDEATSNLDTESEHLIQASMDQLLEQRTTIVSAHRLSTIRRADLILVMENGCIIERGSHGDLMKAKGAYHDMVIRQSEIPDGQLREVFFPECTEVAAGSSERQYPEQKAVDERSRYA